MKKPVIPVKFPEPLNKSVLVEKIKEETKVSTLILTESADDNNVGLIVSVAEDCNPKLRPGLKVIFCRHADRTVLHDGNYYLLMHEMDVFCILPDSAVLMPESKDYKQKRREEGIERQDAEYKRRHIKDMNLLDKTEQKMKSARKKR